MAFEKSDKIWMNGKFINWDEAQIHVLTHALHYGSALFEGIRCYKTQKGPAVFRLDDHLKRLYDSCKIYRMEIPYGLEELKKAILELVKFNKMEECYIRPLVYRGYHHLGVDPTGCPIEIAIAVYKWGKYLENHTACVSTWSRLAPNTLPSMAKCASNYMNSQLIKLEPREHGYGEGIALDINGHVSEGSGENIFIVRDSALITPPYGASILPGVTRNTVITKAVEMGYKVIEENIPREALYIANEVFFTGTAAEISPVTSVDKVKIGCGEAGPITSKIRDNYYKLVRGEIEDKYKWLTYVE